MELDDPYRFPPLLSDFDLHIHAEGTQYESYRVMGAHVVKCDSVPGVRFAVWAPNTEVMSVVGDFNEWDERRHPMRVRSGGVWELFIPGVGVGTNYKYSVRSRVRGYRQQKADPYGFASEVPPKSASVVTDLDTYQWTDDAWMAARGQTEYLAEPVSIYEVHLGSWLRGPHNTYLTYRELAVKLVDYAKRMGYTTVDQVLNASKWYFAQEDRLRRPPYSLTQAEAQRQLKVALESFANAPGKALRLRVPKTGGPGNPRIGISQTPGPGTVEYRGTGR